MTQLVLIEWSGFTPANDNVPYWLEKVRKALDIAIETGLIETQELEDVVYEIQSEICKHVYSI